jgi:hypothetical protein
MDVRTFYGRKRGSLNRKEMSYYDSEESELASETDDGEKIIQ